MTLSPTTQPSGVCSSSVLWDVLAPHHASIEDNYLDLRSAHRLMQSLQEPVLVVGAGQGLIVAELTKRGLRCDGLDSSPEMIRYAKLRRGLRVVQADAQSLPFKPGAYKSIVYATGVVDFIGDEKAIRIILKEGRRVASGKIYAAFYRLSKAQERFMTRVGLLANHRLQHRKSLELYKLSPLEMVLWIAEHAGVSRARAVVMLLALSFRCRPRELRMTMRMQRIFQDVKVAQALVNAAPLDQPYRNEPEIRALFQRLGIAIQQLRTTPSCWIVEV